MKKIIIPLSVIYLSGCGIQKMFDMPDKMDKMNEKMNTMTVGMDNTNSSMGQMISLMGKTVDGVDKQKVLLPFQQLMDEKNYDLVNPVPSKLMPWAKEFAAAVPIKDFAELAYLWLKEIREVNPMKKMDKDGNEIPYTADEIAHINMVKFGRLVALQSVCGFLPDDKLDQVITDHIENYSRFEKTAYRILMMRVQFIRDILLNESLLSEPLTTVGEVKEAVMYASKLDFIARKSFVDKISVKVEGFLPPLETYAEKFDTKVVLKTWNKINLSVQKDFKLEQKEALTGQDEKDQAIFVNKMKDFNQAMSTLNEALKFWNAKTASN